MLYHPAEVTGSFCGKSVCDGLRQNLASVLLALNTRGTTVDHASCKGRTCYFGFKSE
jgi:hypothetical protein